MSKTNEQKRAIFQKITLLMGLASGVLVVLLELHMFSKAIELWVDHFLTLAIVVLAVGLAGSFYYKQPNKNKEKP